MQRSRGRQACMSRLPLNSQNNRKECNFVTVSRWVIIFLIAAHFLTSFENHLTLNLLFFSVSRENALQLFPRLLRNCQKSPNSLMSHNIKMFSKSDARPVDRAPLKVFVSCLSLNVIPCSSEQISAEKPWHPYEERWEITPKTCRKLSQKVLS